MSKMFFCHLRVRNMADKAVEVASGITKAEIKNQEAGNGPEFIGLSLLRIFAVHTMHAAENRGAPGGHTDRMHENPHVAARLCSSDIFPSPATLCQTQPVNALAYNPKP